MYKKQSKNVAKIYTKKKLKKRIKQNLLRKNEKDKNNYEQIAAQLEGIEQISEKPQS